MQVDPRVKDCVPLQQVIAQINTIKPIEHWGVASQDNQEILDKLITLNAKIQGLTEPVKYDFVLLLQHEEGYGMIFGDIATNDGLPYACKAYPVAKQWMSEFAEIVGLKKTDDMDGSKL